MIGLCLAIENYMERDHVAEKAALSCRVDMLLEAMRGCSLYAPYRMEHGSVGAGLSSGFLPRIALPHTPEEVVKLMRGRGIFIGMDIPANAIYLSPLNLTDTECKIVCGELCAVAKELYM